MKSIIGVLLGVLLMMSCEKDGVDGFDDEIQMAHDYKTDPQTGDTIYSLMMPNAFTPNDDGMNDFYRVYGTGISRDNYEMRIYTRTGDLVYGYDDINEMWGGDQRGGGEMLSSQMFIVQIDLTDTTGEEHHYNYRIMLWQ